MSWRIYMTADGIVRIGREDSSGSSVLGTVDEALDLANAMRREFMPDTSGAPGAVRIRQAWLASTDPHAVIVVHVQTPELIVDEWRRAFEILRQCDEFASVLKRRLGYRGPEETP